MNQIGKFRGWRQDIQEWVYGSFLEDTSGSAYIVETLLSKSGRIDSDAILVRARAYEVDPDSVGEFTGIKDLKGIDVFEGDILVSVDHRPFIRSKHNPHNLDQLAEEKCCIWDASVYIIKISQDPLRAFVSPLFGFSIRGNKPWEKEPPLAWRTYLTDNPINYARTAPRCEPEQLELCLLQNVRDYFVLGNKIENPELMEVKNEQ